MPLDKYRAKRDFSKTPEPEGSGAPRPSPNKRTRSFFCVQKHLASHLHYDLRLEHDGVLLSWAVPKGPSLDPSVRRLAMQVEDHPVEYGEFEGVIPEGYGAGIVLLWDRGTWAPEVEDVSAALRKGDLKFSLDGYKLKGSWVLVRTKGPAFGSGGGDGRSWLLIKHRDDWSGAVDITAFAPKSVKSDGDFEHIVAAKAPALWRSNRAAPGKPIGGQAGALLSEILDKAAALRAAGTPTAKDGKGAKHAKAATGPTEKKKSARAVAPTRRPRATKKPSHPKPSQKRSR